jgi:hypothetical protein
MKDNFTKYESMKNSGLSPEDVYREAIRDGIDTITRIRLIRVVFSLTPAQAKELMVRSEGEAKSLDAYQGRIAQEIATRTERSSPPVGHA